MICLSQTRTRYWKWISWTTDLNRPAEKWQLIALWSELSKMGFTKTFLLVVISTTLTTIKAEVSLSFDVPSSRYLTANSTKSLNSTCLRSNETFRCPAWTYCNEKAGICECYKPSEKLVCGPNGKNNLILKCYCLTYNEINDIVEMGPCIYNCDYVKHVKHQSSNGYIKIPNNIHDLNGFMCKFFNRTGTLCGKCLNNTYVKAYSYDMSCYNCDGGLYSWLKYIAVAFLPLTLFCLVVIACRINIPSSPVLGYICLCQIATTPLLARTIILYLNKKCKGRSITIYIQVMGTLYGIWNLDFFRFLDLDICLKTSALATLSLDFFIAIYPLVIIVLIYILTLMYDSNWKIVVAIVKPLKHVFAKFNNPRNVGSSVIHSFASFLFLSNVKFLNVSLDLLLPVQVCSIATNGSCRWAVFNDPSIGYFSHQHLPYATLALVTSFLFVLVPLLTLILYPVSHCQKCLRVIPQRWQIALRIFIDSFQGCLKDGTEQSCRDCRWFSVIPFLLPIIIFSTYSVMIYSIYLFARIMAMIFVLAAILTIIVEPYKPQFRHYSDHFTVYLLFIACVLAFEAELHYRHVDIIIHLLHLLYVAVYLSSVIPQVYTFTVIFYWSKKKIVAYIKHVIMN